MADTTQDASGDIVMPGRKQRQAIDRAAEEQYLAGRMKLSVLTKKELADQRNLLDKQMKDQKRMIADRLNATHEEDKLNGKQLAEQMAVLHEMQKTYDRADSMLKGQFKGWSDLQSKMKETGKQLREGPGPAVGKMASETWDKMFGGDIWTTAIKGIVTSFVQANEWIVRSRGSLRDVYAQTGKIATATDDWTARSMETERSLRRYYFDLYLTKGEVESLGSGLAKFGLDQEQIFTKGGNKIKGLAGTAGELNKLYGLDLSKSVAFLGNLWTTQGIDEQRTVGGITDLLREQAQWTKQIGVSWEMALTNIDNAMVSARQYNVNLTEVLKTNEALEKSIKKTGGYFGITGANAGAILQNVAGMSAGMSTAQQMFFGSRMAGGGKGMAGLPSWIMGAGAKFTYNNATGGIGVEGAKLDKTGRFIGNGNLLQGRLESILSMVNEVGRSAAAGVGIKDKGTAAYLAKTQALKAFSPSLDEKTINLLAMNDDILENIKSMSDTDRKILEGQDLESQAVEAAKQTVTVQEKMSRLMESALNILPKMINLIIAILLKGFAMLDKPGNMFAKLFGGPSSGQLMANDIFSQALGGLTDAFAETVSQAGAVGNMAQFLPALQGVAKIQSRDRLDKFQEQETKVGEKLKAWENAGFDKGNLAETVKGGGETDVTKKNQYTAVIDSMKELIKTMRLAQATGDTETAKKIGDYLIQMGADPVTQHLLEQQ